jgi:hypothetical protein
VGATLDAIIVAKAAPTNLLLHQSNFKQPFPLLCSPYHLHNHSYGMARHLLSITLHRRLTYLNIYAHWPAPRYDGGVNAVKCWRVL